MTEEVGQRLILIIKELAEIEEKVRYSYDKVRIGEAAIILEKVVGIYD